MIRLVFTTDQRRVIGAATEDASKKTIEDFPPSVRPVLERLYDAPFIVVGAASLGPWLKHGPNTTVFVLTRNPELLPVADHIVPVSDPGQLIERFRDGEEELVVAGGRTVFETFLPYANNVDIAETLDMVPGDIVFDEWESSAELDIQAMEDGEGVRTLRLVRAA